MEFCPQPIGFIEKGNIISPIPCQRWDCVFCGNIKKKQLIDRIAKLFKNSDNIMAITLTQKLGTKQNIMKNWNHFRIKMNRKGYKFDTYFWSKEFTIKGERHLHILVDCGIIPIKILSENWKEVTHFESYRTWINQEDIRSAAGYATKYITKAYSLECRFNEKEHRYGFSRNSPRYDYEYKIKLGFYWLFNEKGKFNLEYHPCDYINGRNNS